MVLSIVKKIMNTGILKYALAYDISIDKVQIKVVNDTKGTVKYNICNEFKEIESVSFLQIMNKKLDLFQYENLSNPFLKKSLEIYADNTKDEIENVSVFIMNYKNDIVLSFYNKYENGKNITLAKHLSELGLN